MTLIECPECKAKVDIDRTDLEKQKDGLDLIVKCPSCGESFVLARVAHVRKKLKRAAFGYTKDEHGKERRVRLDQ